MKVHRTELAQPILDKYGEREAVAVETFYDTHIRTWTALIVDANGYQIGHAEYDSRRDDATAYAVQQAEEMAR